jgi:hypothetical protein
MVKVLTLLVHIIIIKMSSPQLNQQRKCGLIDIPIQLIEESTGKYFHELGVGKNFE